MTGKIEIRVKNPETVKLWKELLHEYKKYGRNAEDLLFDCLTYFKRWEIEPKRRRRQIF